MDFISFHKLLTKNSNNPVVVSSNHEWQSIIEKESYPLGFQLLFAFINVLLSDAAEWVIRFALTLVHHVPLAVQPNLLGAPILIIPAFGEIRSNYVSQYMVFSRERSK